MLYTSKSRSSHFLLSYHKQNKYRTFLCTFSCLETGKKLLQVISLFQSVTSHSYNVSVNVWRWIYLLLQTLILAKDDIHNSFPGFLGCTQQDIDITAYCCARCFCKTTTMDTSFARHSQIRGSAERTRDELTPTAVIK